MNTIYEYTNTQITTLQRGLSFERLTRYQALAPADSAKQLRLYIWNAALSESLYTPLQGLEIIARNCFHIALTTHFGEEWYNNPHIKFAYPQLLCLIQAKENLCKEKKLISPGNLISLLPFGFWTGILGSKYETILWRPCLYKAFTNKSFPFLRKNVQKNLNLIRLLRNRIAHHETILRSDLPNTYACILNMITWFCEETTDWIKTHSRFEIVWNSKINPFI